MVHIGVTDQVELSCAFYGVFLMCMCKMLAEISRGRLEGIRSVSVARNAYSGKRSAGLVCEKREAKLGRTIF